MSNPNTPKTKIALWAVNPFEEETRPGQAVVDELKKWAEDWPEAAKKLEEARSAAEAKEKARKAKEASKEERAPKKTKSAPASSDVDVVANELEEMKDLFVEAVVALGKIGDMMRANGKA